MFPKEHIGFDLTALFPYFWELRVVFKIQHICDLRLDGNHTNVALKNVAKFIYSSNACLYVYAAIPKISSHSKATQRFPKIKDKFFNHFSNS